MIQVFLYFCIFVFVWVLIFAMVHEQASVAPKHYLVETENNELVCCKQVGNSACLGPKAFRGPPVADLRGQAEEHGTDYHGGFLGKK